MEPLPLSERLAPFLERGLLRDIPTAWQRWQGTLEMTPYVISPDVTSEGSYRPHLLANPVIRQLFLIRLIGLDHFSTGSGLRIGLGSICKHLILTWHEGMPTYDLQIVQTHPGGLDALRHRLEGAVSPQTAEDAQIRNQALRLFPDPDAYFQLFLAEGGWIDRAAAFDYPSAVAESGAMPEEFYSLVAFLDYCLEYPASPAETGALAMPGHLLRLGTRRLRAGTGKRWLRPA